MQHEYQSSRL